MRTSLALLLTLTLAVPVAAQEQVDTILAFAPAPDSAGSGYLAGRQAADVVPDGSWHVRGIASGALLGLLGTAFTYASAGNSNANVPSYVFEHRVRGHSNSYANGFARGFEDRMRERRKSAALTGGIVGSLVGGTLIYFALAN